MNLLDACVQAGFYQIRSHIHLNIQLDYHTVPVASMGLCGINIFN